MRFAVFPPVWFTGLLLLLLWLVVVFGFYSRYSDVKIASAFSPSCWYDFALGYKNWYSTLLRVFIDCGKKRGGRENGGERVVGGRRRKE